MSLKSKVVAGFSFFALAAMALAIYSEIKISEFNKAIQWLYSSNQLIHQNDELKQLTVLYFLEGSAEKKRVWKQELSLRSKEFKELLSELEKGKESLAVISDDKAIVHFNHNYYEWNQVVFPFIQSLISKDDEKEDHLVSLEQINLFYTHFFEDLEQVVHSGVGFLRAELKALFILQGILSLASLFIIGGLFWFILNTSSSIMALGKQAEVIHGHIVSRRPYMELRDIPKVDSNSIIGNELKVLHGTLNLLLDELTRVLSAQEAVIEQRTAESDYLATDLQLKLEELKEVQAKLLIQNKMAVLGEISGGIAHEINNPNTIILLNAQRILHHVHGLNENNSVVNMNKISSCAETIEKTSKRISNIVQSLKIYSRDGQLDEFEKVKVKDVVTEIFNLTQERFKSEKVDLKVNNECEGLSIECQFVQVTQVLINLVFNALQAIKPLEDQWIRLDILEKENNVIFQVTDSGPGIPEEIVDKILEPFFTTKGIGEGTGLGLSISKSIAVKHNGDLYIDKECSNTRFVLILPKKQSDVLKLVA